MEPDIYVKHQPLGVNGEKGIQITLFRHTILLSQSEAERLEDQLKFCIDIPMPKPPRDKKEEQA